MKVLLTLYELNYNISIENTSLFNPQLFENWTLLRYVITRLNCCKIIALLRPIANLIKSRNSSDLHLILLLWFVLMLFYANVLVT